MSDYNEKPECIVSGAKVLDAPVPGEPPQARTTGISDQQVV